MAGQRAPANPFPATANAYPNIDTANAEPAATDTRAPQLLRARRSPPKSR